ncbi:MAG: acetyl-CoA decarbonylase/synthase complex subunit gamma [Methanomassiliicoccales archaeon]
MSMPTAIEIFKHLPKKNCGKCHYPTCLAFAMQLANSKAKLEDCPFISEKSREELAASSAPPIRLVKFGSGSKIVEIGDETELYRHERKFVHPTAMAVKVSDELSKEDILERAKWIASFRYERVGQSLSFEALAISNDSRDMHKFSQAVELVASAMDMPLILIADSPDCMRAAAAKVASHRPLLYGASEQNLKEMASLAKEISCPLVLKARGLGAMAELVWQARSLGVEDLVMDLRTEGLKEQLELSHAARKHAVRRTFRGLGYPMLIEAGQGEGAVLRGMLAILKYGSIVIFDDLSDAQALTLMVLRQNIFTDPQVPIQVKPGLYAVNGADESSPILFTTNFSLTYFTVLADIEKSRVPAWLLVVEAEGLSVLTAYSAGKLTPESVAKALESSGAKEKSKTDILVMPGMISRMSGKLQELTGMRVIVGPKESSGIPKFLKSL